MRLSLGIALGCALDSEVVVIGRCWCEGQDNAASSEPCLQRLQKPGGDPRTLQPANYSSLRAGTALGPVFFGSVTMLGSLPRHPGTCV